MDGGGRLLRLGTLGDGKRAWGLCGGQMVQAFMPSHLRGGLAMGAVGWVRWEDVRDGRTRTLERDYVDVLGGLCRRGARRANRLDCFCKLRVSLAESPGTCVSRTEKGRICSGLRFISLLCSTLQASSGRRFASRQPISSPHSSLPPSTGILAPLIPAQRHIAPCHYVECVRCKGCAQRKDRACTDPCASCKLCFSLLPGQGLRAPRSYPH